MRKIFNFTPFVAASLGATLAIGGYSYNRLSFFYTGIGLLILALICSGLAYKRLFKGRLLIINAFVGVIVFALAFVAYEALIFAQKRTALKIGDNPISLYRSKLYSFAETGDNPKAFSRWWKAYSAHWSLGLKGYTRRDPENFYPYLVKNSSSGRFFECKFKYNNLGLRGEYQLKQKQPKTYRIIALGESTTWGATIEASDEPWPKKLEKKLNDLSLPSEYEAVEVINAGRPAYNLEHNIARLENLISDLDPDMIISYHGWNGFDKFLPELYSGYSYRQDPVPRARPSVLLEALENKLRVQIANLIYRGEPKYVCEFKTNFSQRELDDAMISKYSFLYDKLTRLVPEKVKVVLVDFNMAIDESSSVEASNFYLQGFPNACISVGANKLHSRMLSHYSQSADNFFHVDASNGLDGNYQDNLFIDMVHFTDEGRSVLASNLVYPIYEILSDQR